MHELAVVSEIIKVVKEVALENEITSIEKIVLDIGAICSSNPDYIEDCFPAVVYKTEFENTKLEINILKAEAKCKVCDEIFDIPENEGVCPKCNTDRNYVILSGTELEIKEIVGY